MADIPTGCPEPGPMPTPQDSHPVESPSLVRPTAEAPVHAQSEPSQPLPDQSSIPQIDNQQQHSLPQTSQADPSPQPLSSDPVHSTASPSPPEPTQPIQPPPTSAETPSEQAVKPEPSIQNPPTTPSIDSPCMISQLEIHPSGAHAFSGQWAMSFAAHSVEGQTSPFELALPPPKAGQPPHPVPCCGTYRGYFMLQQGQGKPSLRVDEKAVQLTFTKKPDGPGYTVQGGGKNRFGIFTVSGTFDQNRVELYRVYQAKKKQTTTKTHRSPKPKPIAAPPPNVAIAAHPTQGGKTIKGLAEMKAEREESSAPGPGRSQRSSRGDWKDKADLPKKTPAPKPAKTAGGKGKGGKVKPHAETSSAIAAPVNVNSVTPLSSLPSSLADGTLSKSGRVRRLPSHLQDWAHDQPRPSDQMRKCLQILKTMMHHPSAIWFNQPVDAVALNIPDYPRIISEPMDFSTIKANLESGLLASPDDFSAAMHLVFKNAIVYNTKKDNSVHIAAKALQQMFDEKYNAAIVEPALRQATVAHESISKRKAPTKSSKSQKSAKSRAGPRSVAKAPITSSPVPASGMVPISEMQEMQRQMQMMQETINMLQQQTSDPAALVSPGNTRRVNDDTKPLSEQEKLTLGTAINELSSDMIPRVLEIIREQMGDVNSHGQEEIEIDMNSLDTPTLHRLQRYVKTCSRKRKPRNQPSPGVDLDFDLGALDPYDDLKRARIDDLALLGFSQDLTEGLDTESEPEM